MQCRRVSRGDEGKDAAPTSARATRRIPQGVTRSGKNTVEGSGNTYIRI
jgi:hypothetical protein